MLLASTAAACGFFSPADDHMDGPINVNELLVRHPPVTFAVRISGESMRGGRVLSGGDAVVDRPRSPMRGCVVLVVETDGSDGRDPDTQRARLIVFATTLAFRRNNRETIPGVKDPSRGSFRGGGIG